MFMSFYSSRILLSTLGFEDFGLYSVVGSISTTFVALKSLFSESLQRFLNVAKGRCADSLEEQVSIFNIGIIVHIVLALFFVIVVEVIGLWLLYNKLDIPDGRFDAAFVVFQMTIMSTTISILSIPFDALIISNEKMGAYAIISIADGILKLIIILSLSLLPYDALKTYSVLMVSVPILTIIMQFVYCKRFPECRFNFKFDKSLFKEVMSLSGWNFFGNISFSLIHEGINMLLNMFGGVIMNAARSIAYQVKNLTSQISNNTMIAVRPMVMQQSAQKSLREYFNTIILLSRVSLFAMTILTIPIFVYCPQLLDLWLDDVPDFTVLFTRIILFSIIIRSLHEPLNLMNMALGSIKRMMLIESLTMLSFLVFTYFALKVINVIWVPFALLAIMELVIILLLVLNAKSEYGYPVLLHCKKVLLPLFIILIIASVTCYICIKYMQPHNFLGLVGCLLLLSLFVVLIIVLLLDDRERTILRNFIKL